MNNKKSTRTTKGQFSKEEAMKRAAEEEAEKQRSAAAAAAEEARLAALRQAEEEEKERQRKAAANPSDSDKRRDIETWLQSIPLSESPLGKIERSFSDGALLAEIISYYCPELCDKRRYFRWFSSINKVSNWTLLNYKVFPKMGFRLSERQIYSLMHPYSCGKFEKQCENLFIYKLLQKVRGILGETNPSVFDYKKGNSSPPPPKPKKARRTRKIHSDRPTYSKIEMMLEEGFYDKDIEAKKAKEGKTACSDIMKSSCCGEDTLALLFQSPMSDKSSCFNFRKSYTSLEDETTIFIRPAVTFLMPQPGPCGMDSEN